MAAVAVSNVSATLLYTPSGDAESVVIQNLGPNPIYIDYVSNVTTTSGVQIATNATYSLLMRGGRKRLYAIAASAAQSSPADTRVMVETVVG